MMSDASYSIPSLDAVRIDRLMLWRDDHRDGRFE
jgi:hypothetical protein